MNDPKPINPHYTESEVWDMLTDYLVKKHLATASSVQRGIYADFHKDGSTFLVDQCEDQFALLYCYRNLNNNISGNIIYQIEGEYSEEFTLQGICDFLGLPFPKELNLVELSPAEIETKNENRLIAEEYQLKERQRKQHKLKIHATVIALFHAFEYERAKPYRERAYHYRQLTKSAGQSRYIQCNRMQHTESVLPLSPYSPSEREFLDYVEHHRMTSDFNEVEHQEVLENAGRIFHQHYRDYFPAQARKVGGLLYPLCNPQGEVISALNVVDIKKDDASNQFLLVQHNATTIGTVQFSQGSQTDQLILITQDLITADILKTLFPDLSIHAALTADNLCKSALSLAKAQPEHQVIVFLNNDYEQIRVEKNTLHFKQGNIRLMAEALAEQGEPNNLGVLLPEFDPLDDYHSLQEIYLNEPLQAGQALLKQLLDHYIERHQAGASELSYLLDVHQQQHESLKSGLKINLPDLVEAKAPVNQATLPHPMIYAIGSNSVLFQESRADLKKWFAEPASAEMQREQQRWADMVGTFAQLSPELSKEDIQVVGEYHHLQGDQFGEPQD